MGVGGDELGGAMSLELRNLKDDNKSTVSSSSTRTPEPAVSRGMQGTRQRMALVVVVLLCIMAFTMTNFPEVIDHYSHSQGKIVAKTDEIVIVPLQPVQGLILGEAHYFMIPRTFRKAKGVLIVLHSCMRSGLEFFHLPEDRIIAQDALKKGLAVLALTSQDRDSGCFTQKDMSWVSNVVDEWTKIHGLESVPRYGLGMSSGGSFLFFVYKELKLESMAVYNTPQGFLPDDIEDKYMVPTAYVTMPRDKPMFKEMQDNYNELVRNEIPAQIFRVTPRPFTPVLCATRFPEMLVKDCNAFFDRLQKDHSQLLDKDGFVAEDLKSGQWQSLFETLRVDAPTHQLDYQTPLATSGHSWPWAAMEQEVRTCHAYHGMTSEHHSSILQFLISPVGAPSDEPDGD
jgi:hypothetical protein